MEATTIRALEGMNLEPVIDLSKSTTPESLLLNVEAELQIMRNRELKAHRDSVTFVDRAEVRVREGWDFTPGVGWSTGIPGRYDGPAPAKPKPHVQRYPADLRACFTDVRTGEQTIIEPDGTVSDGNALDHVPYRDFSGLVRHTFVPLTPSR